MMAANALCEHPAGAISWIDGLLNCTDVMEHLYCGTMRYGFANSCCRKHPAEAGSA
jgi:hypothetical protein